MKLLLVLCLMGSLSTATCQVTDTLPDENGTHYIMAGKVQVESENRNEEGPLFGDRYYSLDTIIHFPIKDKRLIGKWNLVKKRGEYPTKFLVLEFMDNRKVNIKHADLNETFVWSYTDSDIISVYYLNTRNRLERIMNFRVEGLSKTTLTIDQTNAADETIPIGVFVRVK